MVEAGVVAGYWKRRRDRRSADVGIYLIDNARRAVKDDVVTCSRELKVIQASITGRWPVNDCRSTLDDKVGVKVPHLDLLNDTGDRRISIQHGNSRRVPGP